MSSRTGDNILDLARILSLLAVGLTLLSATGTFLTPQDIIENFPINIAINVLFILVTIFTWWMVHKKLQDQDIELSTSKALISEFLPSATFSFALLYYTIPAVIEFVFGQPPVYIEKGVFWDVMQVIGAVMITVSSINWVTLLSE